jgi:hypothetical protein
MKRVWKMVGIATLVAILGLAAVGAVAFAQDDGTNGPFDFAQRFKEKVAEILGVSVEEYDNAVDQAQQQVVDEALQEGWLTEEQAQRMQERMEQAPGRRGMDKGLMGPRMGAMGRGGDSIMDLAAEELGMSVQDLMAELQSGKSLAELADEKGVDTQAIVDAYLAQLEENLQQAVSDGKMTQKQADWMLKQAGEMVPQMLDNTWGDHFPHGCPGGKFPGGGFPNSGFPGGGRPGRMQGFPGQSDA